MGIVGGLKPATLHDQKDPEESTSIRLLPTSPTDKLLSCGTSSGVNVSKERERLQGWVVDNKEWRPDNLSSVYRDGGSPTTLSPTPFPSRIRRDKYEGKGAYDWIRVKLT